MVSIELQARQHEQIYSDKHRKLGGMHYTPGSLVDYIVKRTLRPLLDTPDSLLQIRIIDPACGSGLFLLKAYEVLADCWQKTFGSFGRKDAKYILENSLSGIDIDEQAVLETKKNLLQKASLSEHDCVDINRNIVVGDALFLRPSSTLIPPSEQNFKALLTNEFFTKRSFDCVIGNPPYVRIQNTPQEKRQYYALSYTTAAGRFDIAALFLELSEYLLSEKGRLGFIVSNKILSTAGAKRIRFFLLKHFSIEEIVDLGDTKLFDAAVLPMILIASRLNKNSSCIAYSSITELHNEAANKSPTTDLLQLLEKTEIPFETNVSFANRAFQVQRFYANPPSRQTNVWTFHNERQSRLLAKIRHNSACTIGDLSMKISVGLKTTADNVFIKPMTQEFVQQKALEKDLVFPVIESHNIERWTYSWNPQRDLFVLYPHVEKNGKVIPVELDAYPRIKEYLESNRTQLEARTYLSESNRRWYEIWVHQSPSDFRKKKIITPDLSSYNRFAFDDRGYYINGTCFYLILTDESDISYYSILGLLNSKVIEYFHKTTSGNSLYAKRFRYWSSYIQEYPVAKRLLTDPDIRSLLARNISNLLNTSNTAERTELEKKNDRLCYGLFDFTDNEIREIESTLSVCSLPSRKKGIVAK
jgi:adenine-specific DNA-methyltransferase